MDLALQFGFQMSEHCRVMLRSWAGGRVILSPRDLEPEALVRLAASLRGIPKSNLLLDPQFYLPHSDHARLTSHSYWPYSYDTGTFWSGDKLRALVRNLLALNEALGTEALIAPGLFADVVDQTWLDHQVCVIDEIRRQAGSHSEAHPN